MSGALFMAFGTTISVPSGGLFAFGHTGKPLLFALVVIIGALAAAAAAVKGLRRAAPDPVAVGTRRKAAATA
ncbi:hypothetical protein [Streptomyces fuscichromogenes]|uniref:Uncharacterized protein n=1 Tax=Streptomyces fuscichromogenes TaxID=1324013 RepID=A0A917X9S4_9ACTN|nr:hypothetical protein [Streptomyces fuscichromogenes]GGM98413.1 hypothetical protein GCM10011578_019290 [Streptomyces fuscichromogenes]